MDKIINTANHDPQPIKALDEDGVSVGITGTVLFAIATIVLGFYYTSLAERHITWWFWVAATGTILGIMGTSYCINKRNHRQENKISTEIN